MTSLRLFPQEVHTNFPRKTDEINFHLKFWEGSKQQFFQIIESIEKELIEDFFDKRIKIFDANGLKEYFIDNVAEKGVDWHNFEDILDGAPYVDKDDFQQQISTCWWSWYGPFVDVDSKPEDKLDHFYCFTINAEGNNSYYGVLEIDLRECKNCKGQKRQIATFWTRYKNFTIKPKVKAFYHDDIPEGWEEEIPIELRSNPKELIVSFSSLTIQAQVFGNQQRK